MDWLLNITGLGNVISSATSTLMWAAAAFAIIYFTPTLKNFFSPVLEKIGQYLPDVTDFGWEGVKGLKVLAVNSVAVLALTGLGLYWLGSASKQCKPEIDAAITDLRQNYRFVPK